MSKLPPKDPKETARFASMFKDGLEKGSKNPEAYRDTFVDESKFKATLGTGASALEKLPDEPEQYFHMPPGSKLVSIHALRSKDAQPELIAKVHKLMKKAASGGPKRAPVSVKENGDGTFTVVNGNGTVGLAKHCGWKRVPVRPAD